jgi:hypothetical protein
VLLATLSCNLNVDRLCNILVAYAERSQTLAGPGICELADIILTNIPRHGYDDLRSWAMDKHGYTGVHYVRVIDMVPECLRIGVSNTFSNSPIIRGASGREGRTKVVNWVVIG